MPSIPLHLHLCKPTNQDLTRVDCWLLPFNIFIKNFVIGKALQINKIFIESKTSQLHFLRYLQEHKHCPAGLKKIVSFSVWDINLNMIILTTRSRSSTVGWRGDAKDNKVEEVSFSSSIWSQDNFNSSPPVRNLLLLFHLQGVWCLKKIPLWKVSRFDPYNTLVPVWIGSWS